MMRHNKIMIIGSNGQLGTDLRRCFPENVVAVTHTDLEIANADDVVNFVREVKPSVVLNTAAFHHTPRCEAHPARAYEVNALGALNVAKACESVGALMVHFSTDYVFDGAKKQPYVET